MEYDKYYRAIYSKIGDIEGKDSKNFIIYPFGKIGKLTKKILNNCFGIKEKYAIDAARCQGGI